MKKNLFAIGYPTQVNDWFLTDDDCFQYCKQHPFDKKNGTYQFVQYIHFDVDNYSVVTDTVDIYDFVDVDNEQAYEYIINLLGSYGYGITIIRGDMEDCDWANTLLKEFKTQNGKEWKRIFAECMFENQIFSADVVDKLMNYKEMTKCLQTFLENN